MEFRQGMFDFGTGIREVDAFVHALNPNRLKARPKVMSPDMPSRKHRITTRQIRGIWP